MVVDVFRRHDPHDAWDAAHIPGMDANDSLATRGDGEKKVGVEGPEVMEAEIRKPAAVLVAKLSKNR